MIKVLQVHWEFAPQSSGVARHIDGLSQALVSNCDVDVEIFVTADPQVPTGRGYRVIRGGLVDLVRAISRCDVVHAHGSRTLISAVALRLARILRKPTIFTPHCYYEGGTALRRFGKLVWDCCIERASIHRADAVIILHAGWSAALQRSGFHPRRLEVIPNCIDTEQASLRFDVPLGARLAGSPAVLSVGRLDKVKRLNDVIGALTQLGMEQAVLHIIGRGDEQRRLESLARGLGLEHRIHFHGWQPDDIVGTMMRASDVMVLASEQEGLPTIMLEALAAGIPIAVSQIPGNLAIAEAVGWPFHFPLGDGVALSECLRRCASARVDPDVVARVRDLFTWQSRARDVAALYRNLAKTRAKVLVT